MFDVDIDPMSCPIESAALSRWERKQLQQQQQSQQQDRFVPNREAMNVNSLQRQLTLSSSTIASQNNENHHPNTDSVVQKSFRQSFNQSLANNLLLQQQQDDLQSSKVLSFQAKAPLPSESHMNQMCILYSSNTTDSTSSSTAAIKRHHRQIATQPERMLDAPDIVDDYYLNLLEWSSQNLLAIALRDTIYLWNANDGSIQELCKMKLDNEIVTSVSFMQDGSHLAVGTSSNDVQLWNIERKKQVRSMKGHLARVSSLAWNQHVLSSGSRDSMIFNHDVRIAQHHTMTMIGHQQEVCGLKWSLDGTQLASGSNDNTCCIWDLNMANTLSNNIVASYNTTTTIAPRFTFTESQAAVKALAWCPFQNNLIATGSGTNDRHIRFYNTQTGSLVNSVDTNSQVCSLQWSKTERELLSSHGFSQNQLSVWKYPSLVKIADLTSHSQRVLHTAISPDGTTVASASADETLCFWKVWDNNANATTSSSSTSTTQQAMKKMMMNIR